MPLKKMFITLSLVMIIFSTSLYSNTVIGTYSYNFDTVLSIIKLSLIQEGLDPDSLEFEKNIENIKVMIFSAGESEFISQMKDSSPFSSIEVTNDNMILHFKNNVFEIPISIVKNEILSKNTDNYDEIIGYLESGKLYFNYLITYDNSQKALVDDINLSYFLIPFEKET